MCVYVCVGIYGKLTKITMTVMISQIMNENLHICSISAKFTQMCRSALECFAARWSVLHYVAIRCSVLQRVELCGGTMAVMIS